MNRDFISCFLEFLDGLERQTGAKVVGMTLSPGGLDAFRRGLEWRFDSRVGGKNAYTGRTISSLAGVSLSEKRAEPEKVTFIIEDLEARTATYESASEVRVAGSVAEFLNQEGRVTKVVPLTQVRSITRA